MIAIPKPPNPTRLHGKAAVCAVNNADQGEILESPMQSSVINLDQARKERPDWNPANHRTAERRAADMEQGNQVERKAAIHLMQHGFSVQKITRFDFDIPEYPAGFFNYENDEEGEGWDSFVAFDLLVSGTTSFLAELKLKTIYGRGSEKHYRLDCHCLRRMKKAHGNASDLQHLFVIYDSNRTDAPANGFFAVIMDQLIANEEIYRIQPGFGQANKDAYRIPVTEFRPLTHFLNQHNPAKDTAHETPQKPLPCVDAAA